MLASLQFSNLLLWPTFLDWVLFFLLLIWKHPFLFLERPIIVKWNVLRCLQLLILSYYSLCFRLSCWRIATTWRWITIFLHFHHWGLLAIGDHYQLIIHQLLNTYSYAWVMTFFLINKKRHLTFWFFLSRSFPLIGMRNHLWWAVRNDTDHWPFYH